MDAPQFKSDQATHKSIVEPVIYIFLAYWFVLPILTRLLTQYLPLPLFLITLTRGIIQLAGIVLLAIIGSRMYGRDFLEVCVISKDPKKEVTEGIICGAITWMSIMLYLAFLPKETWLYYLGGLSGWHSGVHVNLSTTLLTVCVIAPVTEEFFFTGVLYNMAKIHYHRILAMVIIGVMFACLHFTSILFLPALMLNRILFLLLYERTDSLMGPILAHALYNLAITLLPAPNGG